MYLVFCAVLLLLAGNGFAATLTIKEAKWESGDRRLVVKGEGPREATIVIKNANTGATLGSTRSDDEGDGEWRFRKEMSSPPCRVRAEANGQSAERAVQNAGSTCDGGSGGNPPPPPPGPGPGPSGPVALLAVNDLGMHCADLDYNVFSILPPFNVVHAQVVQKGTSSQEPRLLDPTEVEVFYMAGTNPADPVGAGSINTTSQNINGAFKTNFWDANLGFDAYDPLYPTGILAMFPFAPDVGLPVPDVEELYLGGGALMAHQQDMPGINNPGVANAPQPFHGFLESLPFFTGFPFGYVADELNRHTAEGVPIMPVDDQGRENAYPVMKVVAVAPNADPANPANHLASVRTVTPVASEADCQSCHADQSVCDFAPGLGLACNGIASTFASVGFDVVTNAATAPGDTAVQKVLNAAKINILRLHDAKHGTDLDDRRPVVCASCHYSPALDLAQLGPNDDNGKEQTRHISMSRAMHGHHGDQLALDGSKLFPDMPPPVDGNGNKRDLLLTQEILGETCYACHPGKRTKCLRGAMAKGGVVCQDCHGNMAQVGNDFTGDFPDTPFPAGADLTKRVSWASEPGCQSCHTGDAVSNLANTPNVIKAADGIRLLQAYRTNDADATPIEAVNRRFAETRDTDGKDHLYRLSKGHGGVMCEGCHGSTHAEWPNPIGAANDNLTALDLQGHVGTITECSVCHASGSLGLTLDGPHGMHPVADRNWNKEHEELAERNTAQCKTCHGANGQGTVLSRTAAERTWLCDDSDGTLCSREGQTITVPKGTRVSCTQCHENEINHD